MDSGLSAGDIMALSRDNGWSDNPFIYLVWLALLGGGNFWNKGNGYDVAEAINSSNTNQDIMRGFTDTATNISNMRYDMMNNFNGTNSAIAENRFAAQQCCCEQKQAIASLAAENYRNSCEITTAIHSEGEETRALIVQNQMQELRDRLADRDRELQTANFLLSQQAQNAVLIDALKPSPIPAYQVSSPYVSTGYGCGCSLS